jgi:hypothetical protein
MKVSTKTKYALEALLCIAVKDEPSVSIQTVSEETHISASYLEQLFFQLRKKGFLASREVSMAGFISQNLRNRLQWVTFIALWRRVLCLCLALRMPIPAPMRSMKRAQAAVCGSDCAIGFYQSMDAITLASLRDAYVIRMEQMK